MSSPRGSSPVLPSSALDFDAPNVGIANIPTSEAVINLLLFTLKYCGGKYCHPCSRRPQPPFPGNVLCLPPPVSERIAAFEPPEQKKIEKLFLLAVPVKLFVKPGAIISALRIYLGSLPENNEKLIAMKNCCGINLSKNPAKYIGWIPRFMELFKKISETRKIISDLKTDCRIFQSEDDELVSIKSVDYLKNKTSASVNVLKKSGHYYYEKSDMDYLLREFEKFIIKE